MLSAVVWDGMLLYLLVVHPGCLSLGWGNKTRGIALLGTSLLSNSHELSTMQLQQSRNFATRASAPASRQTTGQVPTPAIVHPSPIFHQGLPTHIACWNVRSLRDDGVQCITMRTLLAYRMEVACLSEVRLRGSGHKEIKIPHADAT